MTDKRPMTNAERVAACNARKLAAGGARINTVLPPDTTVQLDALVSEHYAESRLAVIRRAITEAYERGNPQIDSRYTPSE